MDEELIIEIIKVNSTDEVVALTRKSNGYDDFNTYLDLTDMPEFMELLEDLQRFDLSQNSVMKNPIRKEIGHNSWFCLTVERSRKGNRYRSVRIETDIAGKKDKHIFHIYFPSLSNLLPSLRSLIREKSI